MRSNVMKFVRSTRAKAAVAGTALTAAAGSALAATGSPGAAIAGELSSGKADVLLVIGAVAVILGVIVLWRYIKRAG